MIWKMPPFHEDDFYSRETCEVALPELTTTATDTVPEKHTDPVGKKALRFCPLCGSAAGSGGVCVMCSE